MNREETRSVVSGYLSVRSRPERGSDVLADPPSGRSVLKGVNSSMGPSDRKSAAGPSGGQRDNRWPPVH